jgi:hypothetical protein
VTVIRAGSDAVAKADRPNYEYGSPRRLRVDDGASVAAIYFPLRPAVPRGAVVTAARLKVRSARDHAAGTYQLDAQRWVSEWKARFLNWNTMPAVAGPVASDAVVDPVEGSVFTFDVLADVADMLAAGDNYGWRVAGAVGSGQVTLWGLRAEARKPTLEIDWVLKPDPPEDLNPAGGAVSVAQPMLEWAADDAFVAYQVQVHTANDFSGAVAYDSGEVPGTDPLHALAGSALSLVVGTTYWWHVRVKNGAGFSDWSSVARTWRTAKPAVAITNPGASSTDPTPLVTWTVAGGVGGQKSWRVLIENSEGEEVDDSDPRTSGALAWLPKRGARTDGEEYTVELRVWDGETRDGTPGDPAFTRVRQTYTFDRSPTPPAPSSLVVSQPAAAPWVDLTWVRADHPDGGWLIERKTDAGKWRSIARLGALAITESPVDTYVWRDWTADPRHEQRYRVSPIVNGDVGQASPVALITPDVKGVWLCYPEDGLDALILGRDEVEAAMQEAGEVIYALGRGSAIVLTTELRGLEGSVDGTIAPTPYGRTFLQESEALEFFRDNPGVRDPEDAQRSGIRLAWADANIPVALRAISLSPRRVGTFPGRINRTVSFEFYQDGELPGAVT